MRSRGKNTDLTRRPPRHVLRLLRKEVGFVCPISGCDRPYLTWHHFDPPWNKEHHHRPEGMIALCRLHADQADNGAFTDDQLRDLKKSRSNAGTVKGEFNWLRNNLLVELGGTLIYDQMDILHIDGKKCIWFNRSPEGYLLLNFGMPTAKGYRWILNDNYWSTEQNVEEIICPPNGRLLEIKFDQKKSFRIEFNNLKSTSDFKKIYKERELPPSVQFPVTLVRIQENFSESPLRFEKDKTTFNGHTSKNIVFENTYLENSANAGGIVIIDTHENGNKVVYRL